ncbi:AAA family ATPase [Williamsia phyllosphaerae]|uniref:MoxR-like ATPase n=1 Tax=Williamsia phyllosphaerae TaxID=885042 RepID=A0ABQ1UKK8_9NOCA|nr:AAA family ATPase [Williamsia phyllosphaerae]GGF20744.1 MoxR-like ATPase [Williamsia phyllosphaerae]
MNDHLTSTTRPTPVDPPVAAGARVERALFEVKRVVVGQDAMVERMLVGLLARGHVLLEGVPGVAKTLAVRTLAEVVGGEFRRLQFTPDLMPGDIVGTRVWRPSTESFDIELGPIFGNLVLADEINRAPAKVQSALLEAMAEKQVSIGGRTFALPDPFLVLATQNPIETDGVYRLPEAQRDRFLLKVDVGHPSELEEMAIISRMGITAPQASTILQLEDVVELQAAAAAVFVHHAIENYIVRLVMATRTPADYGLPGLVGALEYGVSPRGSLGLLAASRALALIRGRDYVLPGDVADLAGDVLAHRLVLTFDASADDIDARDLIDVVVRAVPAPRIAPHEDDAEERLA